MRSPAPALGLGAGEGLGEGEGLGGGEGLGEGGGEGLVAPVVTRTIIFVNNLPRWRHTVSNRH